MSGLQFQDVFEPYYAGRKNPMPQESALHDKDADREEMAHQLADRAKPSKALRTAVAAVKHADSQR